MNYDSNVIGQIQLFESAKFVKLTDTSFPAISVTRIDNTIGVPTTSVEVYPKYAVLTYNVGAPGGTFSSSTTPASSTMISSSGTALAANASRNVLFIQNLGTTPLYVYYGAGASGTVFSYILYGGTAVNDGKGEKYTDLNYKGIVSVSSASVSCVIWET